MLSPVMVGRATTMLPALRPTVSVSLEALSVTQLFTPSTIQHS
jgi:hypothetical protein